VAPYAQWFVRPDLSIEATRRAVRVLGYDLGVVPQVVGDNQLVEMAGTVAHKYQPRVIIVPSVQNFPLAAWDVLREFADAGTTILVSGALSHDQHNLMVDFRLSEHQDTTLLHTVPVSRYERLEVGPGEACQAIFSHDKMGYVRKAHAQLRTYHSGSGKIFWSGLPIELAETAEVTQRVYQRVLGLDGQAVAHEERSVLVVQRPLKTGQLVLLVSESADDSRVTLANGVAVRVIGNRAGAVIVEDDGTLKLFGGVYRGE
jgi:hypothetical protein